jgi:uncharacterized protein YacL
MTIFMLSRPLDTTPLIKALLGSGIGFGFGLLLIGIDLFLRRFNLRSFNIALVGLLIGYLMGKSLILILHSVLQISSLSIVLELQTVELIKTALLLLGIHLGTIVTLRASDELHISIPFVRFTQVSQKKKDLIIDVSVLSDLRIIDLACTGILDYQMVIPRFLIKELYAQYEMDDENSKTKARRCLDVIKKLENISHLELRFNDTDFPEIKDPMSKLVRLARLLDANILSADISRVQTSSIEGITVINMHALSNALKPLMQTGEVIKIKVQRFGKEPSQGVGYLEDGTMVVINGGGDYISETIDARVLSVKHTSSGRMIFCNATEEELDPDYAGEESYHDGK